MHKIENPYCYIVTKLQCDIIMSVCHLCYIANVCIIKAVLGRPCPFKKEWWSFNYLLQG